METRLYATKDLESLARLIDIHVSVVPPFLPVGIGGTRAILDARDPWDAHYPEGGFHSVCEETPCVFGLEGSGATLQASPLESPKAILRATARIRRIDAVSGATGPGQCFIDWLAVDPALPESGGPLIAAIEAKAREWGCPVAAVEGRNHLGAGWFGIPEVWSHLLDRFEAAGWDRRDPWLILYGAMPADRRDGEGWEFRWDVNEKAGEWGLTAFRDGRKAGECMVWGIPSHLAGVPGMEKWINLEYVGVEEEFQRRGLARALVLEQARFHQERGASMASLAGPAGRGLALPTLGVKNFILMTEPDNHAARGLFESLGFAYGPVCWQFRKRLR